jgi:hypothetical protein
MIVREPNGEPKLMVILFMAGLCEASRGTETPVVTSTGIVPAPRSSAS